MGCREIHIHILKKYLFLALLFLSFESELFSQAGCDTAGIVKQLAFVFERDQFVRKSDDSIAYRSMIDSSNLSYVEELIRNYGWPGKSFVGAKGNYTIWLIIQHADLATQEKYLPLLIQSVADSESRPVDLAYLQDRIFMRQDKKQVYGTQVWMNPKTGLQEFWPIEDEKNVNIRRKELGMSTLEEYAGYFGIEYKLPKE